MDPIDFEYGAINWDWGPLAFECGAIAFEGGQDMLVWAPMDLNGELENWNGALWILNGEPENWNGALLDFAWGGIGWGMDHDGAFLCPPGFLTISRGKTTHEL